MLLVEDTKMIEKAYDKSQREFSKIVCSVFLLCSYLEKREFIIRTFHYFN